LTPAAVNNDEMVYDSETLEVLHGLTERGETEYRKMLETAADDILYRSEHPFRWFAERVREMVCR